ncbi:hypothetical protein SISNIDRAFT_469105 [Sistotremastrum niveocremeum HHB9708]|uniref:Uncharacterized protein n=1 Tax=Sistotremastrum niveocremeum HHB9708 TaxID=1314777 RepID=A0A164QE52_9AGAM|nr:hypothetical protein SISNIDRAFT_469105 [Sistotremastrum niveocremeum HHB9708]
MIVPWRISRINKHPTCTTNPVQGVEETAMLLGHIGEPVLVRVRNPPITFAPGLGESDHPRLLRAQCAREHSLLNQGHILQLPSSKIPDSVIRHAVKDDEAESPQTSGAAERARRGILPSHDPAPNQLENILKESCLR